MQLVYEDMPQESGPYQCRAAHISAERLISVRLISVQTDKQTEIDMETNMDVDIGDKSIYTGLLASRDQSINKS